MARAINVTGLGVVSAFGDSCEAFRDALLAGATGIAPVPSFEAAGCRSVLAARVANFDAARWISPMKLRRMDESGPFALVALQQAMQQAAYVTASDGDDRTGVVLGTYTAGGQATNEYLQGLFQGGPAGVPALLFNSTVSNAAAGLAGLEFKLRGPNATTSQKEASGLAAIATAVDVLRNGRADAIAAGGMDVIYDIFFRAHDRFAVMNRHPAFDASAAPFDRCRSGFVMGEGGFVLWLETDDAWTARGALRRGAILGIGATSAVVPINAWPDRAEPLLRTMRIALDEAGVRPKEVHVVYAAANATQVLDRVEAEALTGLFGDGPLVTSIKGAIGEFGAAGSAAVVAALVCGAAGRVPPVVGLHHIDPSADRLRVVTTTVQCPGPIALINSFASGGALYSAVVRVGG